MQLAGYEASSSDSFFRDFYLYRDCGGCLYQIRYFALPDRAGALNEDHMTIFLSGWQATNTQRETAVLKSGWLKARCFSFCNVVQLPGLPYYVPGAVQALEVCQKNKIPIMFDSGVVGWRTYRSGFLAKAESHEEKIRNQAKKALDKLVDEKTFIQTYVDYVKKNHKKWACYMTIDLERIAANIYKRHLGIEAMGIKPVPVFHGDDKSAEYVQKYADLGHKLIAIASWRTLRFGRQRFAKYLKGVFNQAAKYDVGLHGLAMTAPWMMTAFPWTSVDSSSWSRVAGFGGIMRIDLNNGRMNNISVSNEVTNNPHPMKTNEESMQIFKQEIEEEGYNFEELRRDFVQRHIYNARAMCLLAEFATKKHGTGFDKFNLLY